MKYKVFTNTNKYKNFVSKKLLLILIALPMIGFGQIQTILLSENFSTVVPGTGLPFLWNVNVSMGPYGFSLDWAQSYWNGPLNSAISGDFLVADSYNPNPGNPFNAMTQLITPSVSAQAYDSVKIIFNADYKYGTMNMGFFGLGATGSSHSTFSMYVWDGNTDHFVFSVTQNPASSGLSGTYNADITQYITSGTTKVKFQYEGYDGWHCALDDIYIVGYSSVPTGCTDSLACTYDPIAIIDDSSCVYPVVWHQLFSICDGDSVVVGSSVYDTTGNYTDTFNASNGCDSLVYTNIIMSPPVIWQQAFSICDGDSVVVGSSVYNTAGIYTDTLNASNGCDSIVYTNISVDYNTSSYDTLVVTASIVWNGMTLTLSGDYSFTLINSVGCDSIVNLNLTINTTGILNIKGTEKTLLKITDMLGQETPYRRNTPLFYIYDDGTVEKRIIIE